MELSDAERLQYMEALGDKWANQPRGYAIGLALISRVFKYEADQHSELGPWCTGPYVFEIMDILPFKIVSMKSRFFVWPVIVCLLIVRGCVGFQLVPVSGNTCLFVLPERASHAIVTQDGVRQKIQEWEQVARNSPTGLIDDEQMRGLSYVIP